MGSKVEIEQRKNTRVKVAVTVALECLLYQNSLSGIKKAISKIIKELRNEVF